MRTFHIGGTASGVVEQSSYVAKHNGIVKFEDLKSVKNRNGDMIVLSRKAKLQIVSKDGRELQSHTIEYGAHVSVVDGQEVKKVTSSLSGIRIILCF